MNLLTHDEVDKSSLRRHAGCLVERERVCGLAGPAGCVASLGCFQSVDQLSAESWQWRIIAYSSRLEVSSVCQASRSTYSAQSIDADRSASSRRHVTA